MKRLAIAILAGAWLVGCSGNSGAVDNVEVRSARITHVDWHSLDAIFGWSWTTGTLEIIDTAGVTHTAAVHLSGPDLGVILDFNVGSITDEPITLTPPAGKVIHGSDLVGNYGGHKTDVEVIIGDDDHGLSNTSGVSMTSGSLSGGFGVFFGVQWIDVSVD